MARLLLQRRRHTDLEPIEILELEHPGAPRSVGRFTEQLAARCLDPFRGSIHVGRSRNVDLEVAPLPLDPVPAELAVVLVENDPDTAGSHHGAGDLSVVLERLLHDKPDDLVVPANRGLDVPAGERATQRGRMEWGGSVSHDRPVVEVNGMEAMIIAVPDLACIIASRSRGSSAPGQVTETTIAERRHFDPVVVVRIEVPDRMSQR